MSNMIEDLLVPRNEARRVFVAGKRGVGKTSIACITAIWLSRRGVRTLLVTTDPAAHLSNVLGQKVCETPTQVNGMSALSAVNIEQGKAHEEYRARILEAAKGKYSVETLKAIEEELTRLAHRRWPHSTNSSIISSGPNMKWLSLTRLQQATP